MMPVSGMAGRTAGGMESDESDSRAKLERSAASRLQRGFRRRGDRFGNQVSADSASRGPFVRCPNRQLSVSRRGRIVDRFCRFPQE